MQDSLFHKNSYNKNLQEAKKDQPQLVVQSCQTILNAIKFRCKTTNHLLEFAMIAFDSKLCYTSLLHSLFSRTPQRQLAETSSPNYMWANHQTEGLASMAFHLGSLISCQALSFYRFEFCPSRTLSHYTLRFLNPFPSLIWPSNHTWILYQQF